jgi:hypothetical protein
MSILDEILKTIKDGPTCSTGGISIMDQMMKQFDEIEKKKYQIVRNAFAERGYLEAFDEAEKPKYRFSRIAVAERAGWDYFFMNDGTIDGEFIIAIRTKKGVPDINSDDNKTLFNFSIEIEYQSDNYDPVRISRPKPDIPKK